MTHQRTTIRQQMQTLLSGQTPAGTKVYPSRRIRVRAETLPVIMIYTAEESSEEYQAAPRQLRHTLTLSVEVAVNAAADDAVDETLDDFAETIQNLVAADDTLNAAVSDIILSRSSSQIIEDGEQPIGALRMDFTAIYHTDWPPDNNGGNVVDLETIDAKWSLENAQHADDQAHDQLTGLDV